jgi:hypothetical protein
LPLPLGFGENADDIGEAGKIDAAASLHGLYPQRRGEMALPRSGRAEEASSLAAKQSATTWASSSIK